MKALTSFTTSSASAIDTLRQLPLAIILIWVCSLPLHAQPGAKYLRSITGELDAIDESSWIYTRAVAKGGNTAKTEEKRKKLLATYEEALAVISALAPYQGNARLRDSAVAYLRTALNMLNENYMVLADMEQVSDLAYDAMEAYLLARESAGQKLTRSAEMIRTELSLFAAAHGLSSTPQNHRLNRRLLKAERAYSYYNDVYLIFFTSYKLEAAMLQAIAENDVNALEQSRKALKTSSEKGLQMIKAAKPYFNDHSLLSACEKMLRFYEAEAAQSLSQAAQLLIRRDKVQQLKHSYELKAPEERSLQDSNIYNTSRHEYHLAGIEFQRTMRELDGKRAQSLRSWHKACAGFTRRHIN